MPETFETMLTGGHPNSLGRTIEVVDIVLADPARFDELFACYQSADAVVRLRTSNALKRVEAERRDLLLPYVDRLQSEVAGLDQPSAQWTLAQLFHRMWDDLSADQQAKALEIMQRNLDTQTDWIVLNFTMEALAARAADQPGLKDWLRPRLERHAQDARKSVAKRAQKYLAAL